MTQEQIKRAIESAQERKRNFERDLSHNISDKHKEKVARQIETLDVTISALELQISKEPVSEVRALDTIYRCPHCKSALVLYAHGDMVSQYGRKRRNCDNCGQKLDWLNYF